MSIFTQWIVPGINAIVLDKVFPDCYITNALAVLSVSYPSSLKAVRWSLAGYIDMLYLAHGHQRAYYRLLIFLSYPIIARTLPWCWFLVSTAFRTMWENAVQLFTLALCSAVSWYFLSQIWRKKIAAWSIEVQVCLLIAPPYLIYVTCVSLGYLLDGAILAKAFISEMIFSAPPGFSYAFTPPMEPNTQIRLLKLDTRLPFCNVSGELISCDISDVPKYHAISYTWEHGPNNQRTVLINGMGFQVRQNVYDILQRCSSYFEPQLIWLDSICINQAKQEDPTIASEKAAQVCMMQEIYSKAAHVLVCLGNGTAYLSINLMFELHMVGQFMGDAYLTQHVGGFHGRQKTDLYLRTRIKALHELLQHPWFRRVWVVQEVVAAKEVTVCYGQQLIPWTTFYEKTKALSGPAVSAIAALGSDGGALHNAHSYLGILSLPLIVAYRMEYKIYFGPNSISYLLRVFGAREATWTRDKVFALIGVAKRYAADINQLVDYKETTTNGEIMLNLANFLLDHNEAIDVLDFAGIGAHGYNSNLPSWAVDWTVPRSGMPLYTEFAPENIKYHASKTLPAHMIRGSSRLEAIVRGQLVDRITSIAPMSIKKGIPSDSTMATLMSYPSTALAHAREHLTEPYRHMHSQPLAEAVWRTLIGDRTHSARPAPPHYGAALLAQIEMLLSMGALAQSFQPGQMMSEETLSQLHAQWGEERVRQSQEASQCLQDIDMLYDDSENQAPLVFCTMENGWMGMVPKGSEVGDWVGPVWGMHVPCVLREEGKRWRVVGGAYVHGLMDGEGVGMERERDFRVV